MLERRIKQNTNAFKYCCFCYRLTSIAARQCGLLSHKSPIICRVALSYKQKLFSGALLGRMPSQQQLNWNHRVKYCAVLACGVCALLAFVAMFLGVCACAFILFTFPACLFLFHWALKQVLCRQWKIQKSLKTLTNSAVHRYCTFLCDFACNRCMH